MGLPAIPIVSEIVGLGRTWLKGKQKKAEAKAEREAQMIANTASWEQYQAKASADSWKDEYWTIILSLPIVLAFIGVPVCVFWMPEKLPMLQSAIDGQFELLKELPDWFTWAVGASIGASFGFKGFKQWKAGK